MELPGSSELVIELLDTVELVMDELACSLMDDVLDGSDLVIDEPPSSVMDELTCSLADEVLDGSIDEPPSSVMDELTYSVVEELACSVIDTLLDSVSDGDVVDAAVSVDEASVMLLDAGPEAELSVAVKELDTVESTDELVG
jgi:hypothetical protein